MAEPELDEMGGGGDAKTDETLDGVVDAFALRMAAATPAPAIPAPRRIQRVLPCFRRAAGAVSLESENTEGVAGGSLSAAGGSSGRTGVLIVDNSPCAEIPTD